MKIYLYTDFYNPLTLNMLKDLLINKNYEVEVVSNINHLNIDQNIIMCNNVAGQYEIFKKYCATDIYKMLDCKIGFYNYLKQNNEICLNSNIKYIPTYDNLYNGPNIHKQFMIKASWGYSCKFNEIKYGNIYDLINQYKNTHQIQDLMNVKHILGISLCCKFGKIIGVYSYLTTGPISTTSFHAERSNKIIFPEVKLFLKKIVEKLNLNGILEFEFLIDNENKIYIMECNPRISGSIRVPIFYDNIIKTYINNFHNKDIKEIEL